MTAVRRRALLALTIIICGPGLGGCAARVRGREVEQLLVAQTIGLDGGAQGVTVSLASRAVAGKNGSPARLLGVGPSVTEALESIRAGATDEDLFTAHVGHLLIGEGAAAAGIGPLMDYVCRSGDLRLSVPVYILRGDEAKSAVLRVGNGEHGVCDALDSVDADLRSRGDGRTTGAGEILRDLARTGSALVCAVSLGPSAENDESAGAGEEPPLTVSPAGYAVLKDGRLCGFLDREQAVAVGLLTGQTGRCEITVTDQAGLPVTLTLLGGRAVPEPEWDADGGLRSLRFRVEAEALVSESAAGETAPYYLQAMLERTLAERVRQVLRASKQWGADFLDLEGQLELRAPKRMRALEPDFASRWPELPLTVSVSVKLSGVGDREGGL